MIRRISVALLLVATTVHAQPTGSEGKVDAKALMASGVKLFNAKDYLGALVVFDDAYKRFQSAKILLNIATTLAKLDRQADAANAYQRYLESPDADPVKHRDVEKVLAELDAKIGSIALTVTPDDAEVQLDGTDDWIAAARMHRIRVPPKGTMLHVRRDGFAPVDRAVSASVGPPIPVTIALVEIPKTPSNTDVVAEPDKIDDPKERPVEDQPRGRFGVVARGHFDVVHKGAAGLVGASIDATDRVAVQLAALLGPNSGGYAGASIALTKGRVRPLIALGVPVFVSNGARFAARGAGGVELVLDRHFAISAELGAEVNLNPEDGVDRVVFVPSIAATGRL